MADHDTGPPGPPGPAGLPGLLGAALREGDVDGEAERRAVAAFRAARDAGVQAAPTRSQDDWRPRGSGGL
ncbi:hypothetical protein [Streptomyces sp. NBC_00986]|uniref:hypothetical protein n=1 Tax=Streptomyces sp. NBC_00986 TaxID=2903702 RepID=UPI00386A9575|nr:hypothetical protein OG504_21640 [Streptomyces sp. NBC_00986]